MIEARLIIEIPGLESLAAAIAKRNTQQPAAPGADLPAAELYGGTDWQAVRFGTVTPTPKKR